MIYEGEFQSGTFHGQGTSYYDTGIKKYEGQFYMGREQGTGILYAPSGREVFEGVFARDDIQYEALLGQSLEDAMNMFKETPVIYYSEGGTSYLFEKAQVILKTDCLIEMRKSDTSSDSSSEWYVPDDDGETLTETEDSQVETEETKSTADTQDGTTQTTDPTASWTTEQKKKEEQQKILDSLPVNHRYEVYYYLSTDKWQTAEELDLSAITITAVTSYRSELNTDFLKDLTMTPENGAADVQECVAIEKVRLSVPTAFSSISYELTTQNKLYVKVGGINLAEAIYEEVYEENNVRYRLCYQMDTPDQLMFLTVENN